MDGEKERGRKDEVKECKKGEKIKKREKEGRKKGWKEKQKGKG